MRHAADGGDSVAPAEAFSILGNDTRVEILSALGEANRPMAFNELRKRVGVKQGAQFNYHLDMLVGHFVAKTDDGYELRQAGRRVVSAVLSGAVTDDPVIEPTRVDLPCTYCRAPIEVNYRQEMLETYCTACPGAYRWKDRESVVEGKAGHLGGASMPPAGVIGRSPREATLAALTWGHLQMMATASDVCPACAAPMDRRAQVCEDHDASDGICPACEQRFAVRFSSACTNCIQTSEGIFINGLISHTAVQAFLTAHGINLMAPESNPWAAFDFSEEVVSTEPLEVRFTLAVGDDALVVTVDESFDVVAVAEGA